ncbi:hypothetical protein SORBI_3005G014100 [Sorghum bicolor]|uniref:Uncharacterized protein n=2 Tax=Sorghum bicolor TaxID=4558 RepID=C5Y3I1_SORBI|nr:hypothetical protein SORBI_3005G014100 [Sorghum bicolor]
MERRKRAMVSDQLEQEDKKLMRKGLWSPDEDERLYSHITHYGVGTWSSVAELAGLKRSGKSCRLRWMNYLQPDLSREPISKQEEDLIVSLQKLLGNRWSAIAARMPGRTDNEIKNYWNSRIKKKLQQRMNTGGNYQSPLAVHQTAEERDADMNTGGNPKADLYGQAATTSEVQVHHSTTTSYNNSADHPSLPHQLPLFTGQPLLDPNAAAIQNGEHTAAQSSLDVSFSKSHERNFVEEYVEFLMSLSDDLQEI